MNLLTSSTAIVATVLAAVGLVAATLGVAIHLSRRGSPVFAKPSAKRRLPAQWPVNPRPLANSSERQVWHWLHTVFPDHHIMVKLPVTRFTMPRQPGEGKDWFEVLSGAYCSFTICDNLGQVVGCVDVMGRNGLSRGNRQLKQTLLAQCGIAYWVLSPESLPQADALRAEFLGASALDSHPPRPSQRAELESVRHQLHAVLDRNRSFRHHRALDGHGDDALQDGEVTPWPQADSFLGTLDSRRAPL